MTTEPGAMVDGHVIMGGYKVTVLYMCAWSYGG